MNDPTPSRPARFTYDAFPPYRYVPGKAPHPFAHKEGWGFGRERPVPPYHPPERWQKSRAYLFGCDLFNAAYWWEAHETWEELWHVAKPRSPAWDHLLKGLIQLAACSLNREREVHGGASRLLLTACAALQRAHDPASTNFGLDLPALLTEARTHLSAKTPPTPGLYVLPKLPA